MFSISDSNLKHFASLCSEVQRRPALSSGLLLLSYIHSCYKLSPDVYTCQSCRSSCASPKPAGAFLLHSQSVLPIAAGRMRAQATQQAAGGRAAASPLPAQSSGQDRGRGGKAKHPEANSLSKGKDQGKASLALTASSSVSMWIARKQIDVWSGSVGFSFMPRLRYGYQSQCPSHAWSDRAEEKSFSHGSPAPKLAPVSAWLGSQLFLQFVEGSLPHCISSHE